MNQDIIALCIVVAVILYSIYKITKTIRHKQKSACGDAICSGCTVKKELIHLPVVQDHLSKINSGEIKMFTRTNSE